MKTIEAIKVKDGYHITTTETRTEFCKSDVLTFIKQQGLEVKERGNIIKAY